MNKNIKKSLQWLLRHALTVFSCVAIIALGMGAVAYSSTSTTIGENISTGGTLTVSSSSTLATTTISGGDLTVDTNTLFVDSINNRVGIGTISPAYKLDVYGDLRVGQIGSAYDNTLYVDTTNGRIGIGTSSPYKTLSVAGDMAVTGNTSLATTTLSGDLDLSLRQLKNAVLENLADFPTNPVEGQMFWSTASSTPYWYDETNSRWKGDISGATFVVAASDSKNKEKADYVCDGVNDQVEINNAIAALPAFGGTIKLLEGTYRMGGMITIPSYVSIIGSGAGTYVYFNVVQDIGFYAISSYYITIANMRISGVGKTNDPIEFRDCNKCLFDHLWIYDSVDDGIELSGCSNSIISNVIAFESVNYNGIELDDGSYNNIISNCICYNNPLSGIEIDGTSHDNLITNNILRNNNQYGISLNGNTYRNEVYGNMIRDNGTAPFADDGTNNFVMLVKDGSVGIGTTTPALKLDLYGGAMRAFNTASSTCDATTRGSTFYNEANDSFWGCKSSGWVRLDN